MNTDSKNWFNLFDQLNDGIIAVNKDGMLCYTNEQGRLLLNLPENPENFSVLSHIRSLFQIPDHFNRIMDFTDSEFQIIRQETDQFNPLVLVLKGFLLSGIQKDFPRIILIRNDTEKFMQSFLQNEFLTMISHKLRTPIVALNYAMNLVLRRNELQFSQQEADDFIEQSYYKSFELSEVIEKLIRYASVIKDKKYSMEETCSPEEVLSMVIEKYERKYQKIRPAHQIETPACPTPLRVHMPEEYLALVFDCLLDNAVKFNSHSEGRIKISFLPEGKILSVKIEDNGSGIPSEFLEKIFEPFFQVDKYCTGTVEGVGLGLPLVRHILKVYGQTITASSELNRGTTLQFSLPLSNPTL